MKTAIAAGLLGWSMLLVGAPAGFEVRSAEAQVRRTGDSAEVRIVYDLAVHNAACGWFLGSFEDLPGGDGAPKATLLFDGKEYPAKVEERDGQRQVQAFQASKDEGRRLLEDSKSVQLVLTFPAVACTGPEVTVPLPFPRSYVFTEDGRKAQKGEYPRLSVRFDAEVEGATAEVRATFRAVPAAARLALRSDARSAGASLLK
jgi:hypothetical protein